MENLDLLQDKGTHSRANNLSPEILQELKNKFKNNTMMERILGQISKQKNNTLRLSSTQGKNEERVVKNEGRLENLQEKRQKNKKIKDTLQDRLENLNKLISNKTEKLNFYTFGLSQSSSENLMEPLMKLKGFIKKEEELETSSQKCAELNQAIQQKFLEIQEVFGKSQLNNLEASFRNKRSSTQLPDENFVQKSLQSFIEAKRVSVLNNLEERESEQINLNNRKKNYEGIWVEFSKQLEKQEPYLNKKIEDSVKKNLNIEGKRTIIKQLQEIIQSIQNCEKLEPKEKLSPGEIKNKNFENENDNKDEDVLVLLSQNRDLLRYIQALKIRINEFLANNVVSTFEDLQKVTKKMKLNLGTSFENWEKMFMLPPEIYYCNSPEENFSPILQELLEALNHSNKDYYYIPLLIKKIYQRVKRRENKNLLTTNTENGDIIRNGQHVFQQRKRKTVGLLVEIRKELESEFHYREHLERLIDICQNSPAVESASLIKTHGERTLIDYLATWRKLFGSLSKEDD